MATRLSRRRIALYAATELQQHKPAKEVMRQIAAFLIDTKRTREAGLLVRSIEEELERRGIVIATVTTAHQMSAELNRQIVSLLSADKVVLRAQNDTNLIGGFLLETPSERLDATIQHKLAALKAAKI
ncbi:MAG: F0F1 ATP synthase subunit delta [Candidatus Saccharimonas sp.]